MTIIHRSIRVFGLLLVFGVSYLAFNGLPDLLSPRVEAQAAPRYVFDPAWPKPLPNKWKMGGVTGLAVDRNDNVWVLNRPNDTLDIEGHAGLNPPTADCCVRPPAMIHIDKNGDTIGSFDAMQGHGMDVDSQGFVYIGSNTVRKYEPKSGKMVMELARVPEPQPGGGGRGADPAEQAKRVAAFRAKYPPTTPMIVGGLEEIRIDEPAGEMWVADNYLGGRILVFDLKTFAFKRGWGAYGKPLAQISLDERDHDYTPNGPMPKDFAGHLTFNFSNDGLVYMADRNANRIQVTDKQGKYMNKEFIVAPSTGEGGSTGGVAFSTDPKQQFLIISDLTNNKIWFLNRETGKVVGQFGTMGENGGQWFGLHMIAIDTQGNIYTGEVFNGERVQRFVPADSPRGKQLIAAGLPPMS
jgi:DNA-binding beta-propeller fold protein YncE